MPQLQLESLAVTTVVFLLSLALTFVLTRSYFRGRKASVMFWSAGMWAFTAGVLLEIAFALNASSELLIALYLFIVALLVELLALGSIQLIGSNRVKRAYYVFCVITTVFIAYSLLSTNITNLIRDYIVYGNPPLLVIVASSLVTFPAAVVLIAVAVKSYLKTRSYKMLSIIAGVVVVSVAGTLYIASFPSILYAAEFVGIVLLWIGFYTPAKKSINA